jgi:hypothetical protein
MVFGESPTYLERIFEISALKKVALIEFEAAEASNVFPVPGGPKRRIDLGGSNFTGFSGFEIARTFITTSNESFPSLLCKL